MKLIKLVVSLTTVWITSTPIVCKAHDIIFCGERIPVNNNFVADKLMSVIRRQIPYVNLPDLRKRVEASFPVVEYYLRETGLPEDFKYLPIVESGFLNVSSPVGARGFWQLMDKTARQWGLTVSDVVDERDNLRISTYAACKVLASYYLQLRQKYGVSSWVLTAAAYNFGIGNITKAINKQGNDYFSMTLNLETALYVYKIIAVKELFEYPELYMKDFGYNVFQVIKAGADTKNPTSSKDSEAFNSMTINVNAKDGYHPENVVIKEPAKSATIEKGAEKMFDRSQFKYIAGNIKGKYKNFDDGNLVSIELLEDLEVTGSFSKKGNVLKGKGWIIGDRIFIDLGYSDHAVTLLDNTGKKGVLMGSLKKGEPILLKVENNKN